MARTSIKMESRMITDNLGTKRWHNEKGELHREDGPAVIWKDGKVEWYRNGMRHREDGPAMVWPNGEKKWFQNGLIHREDGPAWFGQLGEWWFQHNEFHREDGPAVIYSNGGKKWYLNGKNYSFQVWANELNLDHKTRLEMVLKWNPE